MLFLTETLLSAAGFQFDGIDDTWAVPEHLSPVVTVECDERGSYIMEALLEVHAVLEAVDCTYNNFAISNAYVSIVGLTTVRVAAVA